MAIPTAAASFERALLSHFYIIGVLTPSPVYVKHAKRTRDLKMDFSLSDLEDLTAAKRRSIQLWADAGVIRAYPRTDRRGTGTHRRFSRDEAIIACIIAGLANRQRPIGELLRLSVVIRNFLNSGKFRKSVEAAISGKNESFMVLRWGGKESPEISVCPREELESALFYEYDLEGDEFEEIIIIPLRRHLRRLKVDL
jgi:hypothetical protein